MTKTNFQYMAAMLRHAREKGYDRNTIEFCADYMAEYFSAINPRFDRQRFFAATQPRKKGRKLT